MNVLKSQVSDPPDFSAASYVPSAKYTLYFPLRCSHSKFLKHQKIPVSQRKNMFFLEIIDTLVMYFPQNRERAFIQMVEDIE